MVYITFKQPTEVYEKMKKCSQCKQEKNTSEFSKDKYQKDGLRCHCKVCHSLDHKKYYNTHRNENINKSYEWRKNNPDKVRKYYETNIQRYPEKHKAKLLSGQYPHLLTVLGECNCNIEKKQNHHPDYSKPFEVIRLCTKCHGAEHRRLRSLSA